MSENFKPGDVATDTTGRRIFFTKHAGWIDQESDWRGDIDADTPLLAVVDHRVRKDVERLDALIDAGLSGKDSPKWPGPADILQAALREFANPTPPKPDEPTGLGAVVEDADGRRWTKADARGPKRFSWRLDYRDGQDPTCQYYSNINAVRVLSEGVQS